MKNPKLQRSFTLIEILIVIGIVAIIAAVVIIAINPARQFAYARNTQRWVNINAILNAIGQYIVDKDGAAPSDIDTTLKMLGTDMSGCNVPCGIMKGNFLDDTKIEFDDGEYTSNTEWGTDGVKLKPGFPSGNYTSSVKDGGSDSASWDKISWEESQTGYGIEFQARSDSTNPPTGNFIGPGGLTSTYYTNPLGENLSDIGDNRYFQYRAYFKANSRILKSVKINFSGGFEMTDSSCLDLTPDLVTDYLSKMPHDPGEGSLGKTYYAVKKTPEGRIIIRACSAELGENIRITR